MITKVIELIKNGETQPLFNISLSLRPFIEFVEKEAAKGYNDVKSNFFKYIAERIHQIKGCDCKIDLHDINRYEELLQYIYLTLLAPATDEKQHLWALGMPLSPVIFYGTDALYHFLLDEGGRVRGAVSNNKETLVRSLIYSLALQRLYGLSFSTNLDMTQVIPDENNKLKKAYNLQFDTRFMDLQYLGEKLPIILPSDIHVHDNIIDVESLAVLEEKLPPKDLLIEGFNIVSITDITTKQAIENIKNIIVNLAPGQMVYDDVIDSLKNLIGTPSVHIRIIPMLKVNDKLIINSIERLNLKVREICTQYGMNEQVYIEALEQYSYHPEFVLKNDLEKENVTECSIYGLYKAFEIKSMAVIPIYFQKDLVGVLELYSKEKDAVNEKAIASLEPAVPLLEQLLQTNIDDFNIMLDNVIKDKFTSLQPSVQWRFNEAAWHYLQKKHNDKGTDIEPILFEQVYPLYGSIDIRNSTVERNLALQADLKMQFGLLSDLLEKLGHIHPLGLIEEMNFKAKHFLNSVSETLTGEEDYRIRQFFEEEIVSFLLHFRESFPSSQGIISDYYLSMSPTGVAFSNQAALEQSMRSLNTAIVNLLDQMNIEIQNAYPCFFEKFRSDGVEYDIYIGQSITPDRAFHPMYLKNLRLWQLTSMAVIAKLTKAMLPELPKPLNTTQLIFIHTNPIEISFRNDERHFDVEGAYNIRYEVVKKRIDKVHIRNSEERLTQPDKIALIYFQQKDVEDYLSYVDYLQSQNILNHDLEFLELEDLQGVSGLKALRIGVNMEAETETTGPVGRIFDRN